MSRDHSGEEVVWRTQWFQVVATQPPSFSEPHYSLRTLDYVTVIARNPDGQLLLVRQFRPAVGATTLELPGGHVEESQSPEDAARQELREETGHAAEKFEFLGNYSPDTGRLRNRMWCYFAGEATPTKDPQYRAETGIEVVRYAGTIRSLVAEQDFCSALNCAALFAAVLKGHLTI